MNETIFNALWNGLTVAFVLVWAGMLIYLSVYLLLAVVDHFERVKRIEAAVDRIEARLMDNEEDDEDEAE